jgi:hypothetical protein
LLTPGEPIENAGQGCQQDIAPVESRRTLIEMRKAKQGRSDEKSPRRPDPAIEKILHPATKEKFFRHGNKKERKDPGGESVKDRRGDRLEMEEAQHESQHYSDRSIGG